jgi:hypothetical protein
LKKKQAAAKASGATPWVIFMRFWLCFVFLVLSGCELNGDRESQIPMISLENFSGGELCIVPHKFTDAVIKDPSVISEDSIFNEIESLLGPVNTTSL